MVSKGTVLNTIITQQERDDFYKKIGAIEINVTTMKDEAVIKKICEMTKDGKQ